MTLEEQKRKFAAPFATNLRELMKDQKVTATALSRDLEISRQAVNQYMEGTGQPNAEKLTKIADYFNVSVDWLLGRSGGVKTINADLEATVKYTGLSANAAMKIRSIKERKDLLYVINELLEQEDFWEALDFSVERKKVQDILYQKDDTVHIEPPSIDNPMFRVVDIDMYDEVLEQKIIDRLRRAIDPL